MVCVCGWGGGGGADPVLMTCVYPYDIAAHASNWDGRTPGSLTPGVPATPSPRRRRTRRHRGLKNGHSRPAGRSAKNVAKYGKIANPHNLNILSMNRSEAPPGTAGNLSLHFTATSTNMQELQLRHLHGILQCLGHPGLSLHNDRHVKHDLHNRGIGYPSTYCNWGTSMVFRPTGPWGSDSAARKECRRP